MFQPCLLHFPLMPSSFPVHLFVGIIEPVNLSLAFLLGVIQHQLLVLHTVMLLAKLAVPMLKVLILFICLLFLIVTMLETMIALI